LEEDSGLIVGVLVGVGDIATEAPHELGHASYQTLLVRAGEEQTSRRPASISFARFGHIPNLGA
jgi:hypothetical protein